MICYIAKTKQKQILKIALRLQRQHHKGHLWSLATAVNISRATVNCFLFYVILFAMLPAHGIWRETVSLLDVMWPWISQWMGVLWWKKHQLCNNINYWLKALFCQTVSAKHFWMAHFPKEKCKKTFLVCFQLKFFLKAAQCSHLVRYMKKNELNSSIMCHILWVNAICIKPLVSGKSNRRQN